MAMAKTGGDDDNGNDNSNVDGDISRKSIVYQRKKKHTSENTFCAYHLEVSNHYFSAVN